jgi:uncharacterized protein (DUF2267 family)
MDKLSSEQAQAILGQIPGVIRGLVAERDFWQKEAQARMQRDDVEKVASAMHAKGISQDVSYSDLVEQLEKSAAAGELDTVRRAVDLVGPNMGEKIASLSSDDGGSQSGASSFEQFIMGGVG